MLNPAVDYYGVTFGIRFRREHRIASTYPNGRSLIFSTCMGARYALAVGRSAGLLFDPFSSSHTYESGQTREVMFYDLSWFMGSAVLF
jgi:hypothetical protein